MAYHCEEKIFSGKWIRASEEYLRGLEEFPPMQQEPGEWIWPQPYVREHMRREFCLAGEVESARLEFWCDNEIDVFVNGVPVSEGRNYTGVLEVGACLKEGRNIIAVRAYQTATPLRFTAAMRGSVVICLSDGSEKCIRTDENWHAYEVCDFHAGQEPEQWTTMENPGRKNREERQMVCTRTHHRLLRRSCYFRKAILVGAPVEKAELCVTAKGIYEAFVNGERADDALFSPGIKEKYQEYQVIDVKPFLHPGNNMLAFWLGNGWYNCTSWGELRADRPSLLGELTITYGDGRKDFYTTDDSWMVTASPLIDNDLQFGERYDAREEVPNWNKVEGEGDERWQRAEAYDISPEERPFVYQDYPPIRGQRHREAASVLTGNPQYDIYDFGVTEAGRSRIVLRNCRRREAVIIQYCERLNQDGSPGIGPYRDVFFPRDSFPDGKAPYNRRNIDVYICKGEKEEVYEPRFAYTGFRYIYVEKGRAEIAKIEMVPMNTDLMETGKITTDHKLICDLWERITRSYRSNIFSGPTDCPTREKNFWNGDTQAFSRTACWYMDNSKFLARWTDGGRKLEKDVYGYEDEEYILPLVLYMFYGDREIVRVKYPAAKELLKERQRRMSGILPLGMRAPYRDWLAVDNGMSSDFLACCYYCLHLNMLSRMAAILGNAQEERQFKEQYDVARKNFLAMYYEEGKGDFGQACQGGQILPLALGLVPVEERRKAMDRLLFYIREADDHLTTGIMTTGFLLGLLCDFGHADVAWKIFTQKDFPSWQYMIDTGATAITEDWKGILTEDPSLSMNHFSLGSVGSWFFEYLGGIRVTQSGPGLEHIVMKPLFVRQIGQYGVSYQSVKGKIESSWKFAGDRIYWKIKLPEGTDAEVCLPEGKVVCAEPYDFEFQLDAKTDCEWII